MKNCKSLLCLLAFALAFTVVAATAADAPPLTFKFTKASVPGATTTSAGGINNSGMSVGSYTDSAGNSHGFVYKEEAKSFQSVDDPDGVGTTVVNGINDKGDLVGFFDSAPIKSGFIATPVER